MICCWTCFWYLSSSFVSFLRMNRLVMYALCILCVGLLTWCGGSSLSDGREITLDGYLFMVPGTYVDVSPALVENKQLVNKVIGSYKLPTEVTWSFEPNIIVTRSELPPELNFEQFRTLNAQKLDAGLAWYQPWSKEVISFVCNERTIQWLLVFFRLQDPRYTASPEVWMAQYQFVDNQKWYIISAAYTSEDEQEQFIDIIDTLTCIQTTSGTGST